MRALEISFNTQNGQFRATVWEVNPETEMGLICDAAEAKDLIELQKWFELDVLPQKTVTHVRAGFGVYVAPEAASVWEFAEGCFHSKDF